MVSNKSHPFISSFRNHKFLFDPFGQYFLLGIFCNDWILVERYYYYCTIVLFYNYIQLYSILLTNILLYNYTILIWYYFTIILLCYYAIILLFYYTIIPLSY